MRKLLLAIALGALGAQAAHADGAQRFNTDGMVQIRFFFDDTFVGSGFTKFRDMERDLLATLQDIGKHQLGIKFQGLVEGVSTIHLPRPRGAAYTGDEVLKAFQKIIPPIPGYVNVLIHNYPVTPTGTCGLDDPNSNTSAETEGYSLPALDDGVGGIAAGTVTMTAKLNCSANNSSLKSTGALRDTFVHEFGHILLLNDMFVPYKSCTTRPTASVMCNSVGSGIVRSYNKWFLADIQIIRTAFFGASRKTPTVACFEWSSFQACDTNCVNGAGFPDQGATGVYEACTTTQCNHICAN